MLGWNPNALNVGPKCWPKMLAPNVGLKSLSCLGQQIMNTIVGHLYVPRFFGGPFIGSRKSCEHVCGRFPFHWRGFETLATTLGPPWTQAPTKITMNNFQQKYEWVKTRKLVIALYQIIVGACSIPSFNRPVKWFRTRVHFYALLQNKGIHVFLDSFLVLCVFFMTVVFHHGFVRKSLKLQENLENLSFSYKISIT